MFGLRKKKETEVLISLPTRPAPTQVIHGAEPLGAYEALAKELEFEPAQLLEERLLRFLGQEGIPTFDHNEVDRYLASIAENEKKVWIWRPLRERDKPAWVWSGRRSSVSSDPWRGHGSYRDEWDYRPYDKAIPIHILRHVKKIQDEFGDKVLFFVSDYAVPDPDPFIMVTALDMAKIVFGVWDEPGFGTATD